MIGLSICSTCRGRIILLLRDCVLPHNICGENEVDVFIEGVPV